MRNSAVAPKRHGARHRAPHAGAAAERVRCTARRRLEALGGRSPALFLFVSLRHPAAGSGQLCVRRRDALAPALARGAARPVGRWRAGIPDRAELERRGSVRTAHARLADLLPVRPARGVELQWLVRRAFCRGARRAARRRAARAAGAGVRAQRRGGAGAARGGRAALDGRLRRTARPRRCGSSQSSATSWQAQLVLGALPERAHFPGAAAELMFAPPEESAVRRRPVAQRALPAERARACGSRAATIQDADQIVRAESDGEQGVTDSGYERTQEARDLLAYLQASSRPPLLRATLAIAVAAGERGASSSSASRLCRRAYGEIACTGRSATSSSCSCSTCRASARASRATTTC